METYSDQVFILPWEGTESAETLQPLEPEGSLYLLEGPMHAHLRI